MRQYLIVTNDQFETVVASADSITELARVTGRNRPGLSLAFKRWRQPGPHGGRYKYIEVDDADPEDDSLPEEPGDDDVSLHQPPGRPGGR